MDSNLFDSCWLFPTLHLDRSINCQFFNQGMPHNTQDFMALPNRPSYEGCFTTLSTSETKPRIG